MLDIPEIVIAVLIALTVVVWTHSWIVERREDRGTRQEETDVEASVELVG
jgi:hypothetical protein